MKATMGSLELLILHCGNTQVTANPSLIVTAGVTEPFEVLGLHEAVQLVVTTEEGNFCSVHYIPTLHVLNQIVRLYPLTECLFYLEELEEDLIKIKNRYEL